MNSKNKIAFALLSSAFLFSCTPDKKTDVVVTNNSNNQTVIPEKPRVIAPDFNSDSAFAYVKAQADMGPRTPGSKAHDKCVAYFEKQLKKYGADVKIQGGSTTTFDGKQWRIDNVIASFNPTNKERILLCAHYDSRPFADRDPDPKNQTKPVPGVNDGASGAGVLLEIARVIQSKAPEIGIDIILFDLEDYGESRSPETWCLGSQYWANNMHKPGYTARYGILLDMVGAKGATFPKEGGSLAFAADVVDKVWKASEKTGYKSFFSDIDVQEMTDDNGPINEIAKIKCIDIIHYIPQNNNGDFFEHHHRITDDLSNIDKTTLKAVGQTLLEVIYNEEGYKK